ncbi:uncharacterized protein LOC128994571 [Macrosteles quadrilineatus]|uniref:uncharacterized protein LOC128994571 n=1 Tax=Macrosteles quadrilineatus TaxID=74068 RepID=UPI0023E1CF74|nr:uncharacterized protein LOC128994571 [Macrosteles quadrilineatus]
MYESTSHVNNIDELSAYLGPNKKERNFLGKESKAIKIMLRLAFWTFVLCMCMYWQSCAGNSAKIGCVYIRFRAFKTVPPIETAVACEVCAVPDIMTEECRRVAQLLTSPYNLYLYFNCVVRSIF